MGLHKVMRLGDIAHLGSDCHGCVACCHDVRGPSVGGSPDTYANGKPIIREGDPGVHAICCGTNTWEADTGSSTVYANGIPIMCGADKTQHCGGMGEVVESTCSPNVKADS